MKIDSLMEILPQNYSVVDRDLILRAYRFAETAHQGQKRASGEPYVSHCIAVASILAEMNVPPAVVIAGLLHDTVEDTNVTLDDIKQEFGEEVRASREPSQGRDRVHTLVGEWRWPGATSRSE